MECIELSPERDMWQAVYRTGSREGHVAGSAQNWLQRETCGRQCTELAPERDMWQAVYRTGSREGHVAGRKQSIEISGFTNFSEFV
jgi:hypothetical protein